MPPPKIAVVGSINEDFIFHGKFQKHTYGGILYNLTALASLQPDSEIYALACLGRNIWPLAGRLTRNLANLNWDLTPKMKGKSNQVALFYSPTGEKNEILKHPVPAFSWEDLKPALEADSILLNFISGWEVSPRLFQKLRQNFSGLIQVDLHSLLLEIKKNGQRFARVPKNWEFFLDADFVQMNRRSGSWWQAFLSTGKIFCVSAAFGKKRNGER